MTTRSATSGLDPAPIDEDGIAQVLTEVRERAPLVQCVTNVVVANFTANALLAVGGEVEIGRAHV